MSLNDDLKLRREFTELIHFRREKGHPITSTVGVTVLVIWGAAPPRYTNYYTSNYLH